MGRHSMNYRPEPQAETTASPEASIAPPPGEPGSPDAPSTVPGAPPAEPTQPSEPSWPVGPDGPEIPAEPEPSRTTEPPPFAPDELDDVGAAQHGTWHAAGEEALR